MSRPGGPAFQPGVCWWLSPGGTAVSLTAVAREAPAGLDLYKCDVPGRPDLAQRLRTVISQARLTEPRYDSRSQVQMTLSTSEFDVRDGHWELAAVIADRLARRRFVALEQKVWAHGRSEDWTSGQVSGSPDPDDVLRRVRSFESEASQFVLAMPRPSLESAALAAVQQDWRGELTLISHLGGLQGHPDELQRVSRASAWFPLVGGGAGDHDTLARVDVAVRECVDDSADLSTPDRASEDKIEVNGLPWTQRHAAASVLSAARMLDRRSVRRWVTVASFSQSFQMRSYELALVLADRLARGRMLPPRGRLIATGMSPNWSVGAISAVDGLEGKCRLILRQAGAGDRILLPAEWRPMLAPDFVDGVRDRGASLAFVSQVRDIEGAPRQADVGG